MQRYINKYIVVIKLNFFGEILLLHTSDIHIGAFADKSFREANIDALEEIAEYALNNDVKYLLISGDLFENPRLENFELIKRTFIVFRRLKEKGVYTVLTPGSHDHSIMGRDHISILEAAGFAKIPKYEFIDDKLILHPMELEDYVFYAIPGLKNSIELEYICGNRIIYKGIDNVDKPIILLAHTGIDLDGFRLESYSERYGRIEIAQRVLDKIPAKIKYIALGHIHLPYPLLDSGNLRACYPGSPVGRDIMDLYETIILKKKFNKKRRFLLVDTSSEIPLVKSIWSDFNVCVEELEFDGKDVNQLITMIRSVLSKMVNSRFRALLVSVKQPPQWINSVNREIRDLERETNSYIRLVSKEDHEEFKKFILRLPDVENIENLEREALHHYLKTKNLDISLDKLIELLNILSRTPEDQREADFVEELFKQVEALLKEVVKK
uniref:DNA repair exonuclease n=1 Tax=Staphylothermus marinus TaxID=2280 RepID=A0A7C4NPL1_STAMA